MFSRPDPSATVCARNKNYYSPCLVGLIQVLLYVLEIRIIILHVLVGLIQVLLYVLEIRIIILHV